MHLYTQPHTCTCNMHTNMHVHNTTHNTMCTQDGHCPLYIASQEGHDRVVEMLLQAGATVDLQSKVEDCYYLSFCHLCCAMCIIHCRLSTTQHSGEYVWMSKNIQQITAADIHWRMKSFVHWKHVHLVHGLGTFFPNKFGLRMLVWDQNSSERLAIRRVPVCKSGP